MRNSVNAKDKEGLTALMWAAIYGKAEVIQVPLDAGADVNIMDNKGHKAIDYAGIDYDLRGTDTFGRIEQLSW